jgi:hypothetical protein
VVVWLANRRLGIRHAVPGPVAGHGDRPPEWGAVAGPWPGRAEEGGDVALDEVGGRVWVLALDPAAWPVQQRDLVVDADSGQEWLVTWADLRTNNVASDADYVRVEAHARTQSGTRP